MLSLFSLLLLLLPQDTVSQWEIPKGIDIQMSNGKYCTARFGLPYAEPPVGERRFKRPQQLKHWRSVDATKRPPICMQVYGEQTAQKEGTTMSEDCLYVNVYGPKHTSLANLLPVVVHVHGGAFKLGSANEFPPESICENFVTRGVVVVTVQYRVGMLGLFSDGTDRFPGNLALHDILAAVEWVQWNIHQYGGDPTRKTIMGHSAGACAVNALAISPVVPKELFQNVILQSGVVEICFEGTFGGPNHSELGAKQFCNINISDHSNYQDNRLSACLQDVPAKELADFDLTNMDGWKLVVDNHFFKYSPIHKPRPFSGIKYLIGGMRDEWAFFEGLFLSVNGSKEFNEERFRRDLKSFGGITKKMCAIEEYYTKDAENIDWLDTQINALTDIMFITKIVEEIIRMDGDSISVYSIDIEQQQPFPNGKRYAPHGEELQYLFGTKAIDYPHLIDFWTRFITNKPIATSSNFHRSYTSFTTQPPYTATRNNFGERAYELLISGWLNKKNTLGRRFRKNIQKNKYKKTRFNRKRQ